MFNLSKFAGVSKTKGSTSELAAAGRKEAGDAKSLPKTLSEEKNGKRKEIEQPATARKGPATGPASSGKIILTPYNPSSKSFDLPDKKGNSRSGMI